MSITNLSLFIGAKSSTHSADQHNGLRSGKKNGDLTEAAVLLSMINGISEAIQRHHLRPRLYKISNKLLVAAIFCVNLRYGAKLGM